MLNPKEFEDIMRKHFEEVTPEEFLENVNNFCPEFLDDDLWQKKSGKFHRIESDEVKQKKGKIVSKI